MSQQSNHIENISSPTLEALCQDLDSFINELGVNDSPIEQKEPILNKLQNKRLNNIIPLDLNNSNRAFKIEEYIDEDEITSYSPVLDNYTRFSDYSNVLGNGIPSIVTPEKLPSSSLNQTTTALSSPTESPLASPTPSAISSPTQSTFASLTSPTTASFKSPPLSPSLLRVAEGRRVDKPKEEIVFATAPRTSSLNRTASSGSGRSILHPKSPRQFFSNPTSPLAFEVPSVHAMLDGPVAFPIHAFLSVMRDHVVSSVRRLNERRRIYCSAEYPLSFSGEEMMDILHDYSPVDLGEEIYIEIVQCFMHSTPKLIKPIDSSEKSIRNNKFYNSSTEMYTLLEESLDQEIQGIYTPLASCYSTSCLPGQSGCYSPSCPNKLESLNGPIVTEKGSDPSIASSGDTAVSRAWSASVSKDILKTLASSEINRQEAIFELIYTEEDYVRDLKILDVDYAKELMASPCMEESRKEGFIERVMNNYLELLEIHTALYQELRDHQIKCQATSPIGAVDHIGDIFLRHVPHFLDVYLRYGPHVVLAEYEAKLESDRNPLFQEFIKTQEALPQCRRLPFRHFIILPVTRLQRYALLLGAVLKKTPDDNPDKIWIAQCMDQIKAVAEEVDDATSVSKNTLRVLEINDRIRFKPEEYHDLRLTAPGRRLIKEGTLTRRSHMNVETIELHVFLFDHLFLMTKVKRLGKDGDVEYVISKRPIPMELLQIQEATEGFSIGMRNMSSTYTSQAIQSPTVQGMPLLSSNASMAVCHLGRRGADYILYAENPAARIEWKESIVQAKANHEMADIDKRVFEIRTLSDTKFGSSGSSNAHNHGKVTCTVPFMGTSGIRMIAIGTQQGVWTGIEGDTNTINLAIAISDVQQIAVLEDEYILLILADKTLYAYSLEHLLSPNKDAKKGSSEKPHQKIAQHISFFQAGVCNGKTIVIAMKKRGVDSNFRVLEPVCGDLRDPQSSKYFAKSGLFSKSLAWFKNTIEFYIGTESYGIQFLKARVVVVCARGFEVIDLEKLSRNRNLPDMTNPDFQFVYQRGQDVKPLGMFRCRENYLLCYDTFAFTVDVHGTLIKDTPLIEWEGVPQSVAFYYPYVIGFDNRFVEIRNVETGEVIQVLAGTHMRCLQFISNNIAPDIHGCMSHPFKPDFQYIFQLVGTFEPPL